jgi:hypothetical protein
MEGASVSWRACMVTSARRSYEGDCECYLGQNSELCKHMVATTLYAVLDGRPITDDEKRQKNEVRFFGTVGGCMEEIVDLLQEFARVNPSCCEAFRTLVGRDTCFG